MIHKKNLIFLLAALCCSLLMFKVSAETESVSTIRLKKIQKLVDSYAETGKDITSPAVKKNIYKDISTFLTLKPDIKVDARTNEAIAKEVRTAVEKSFPDDIKSLRKRVEEEASKKFKMANLLDNVHVEYQRGTKFYTVSGTFYNYGGNSIRVGDRIIAIFDLMPESRAMFDKEYCNIEKEKFISKKLNDYQQKKIEYSTNLSRKIKDDIIQNNENAGYIYILGNWKTPLEVADIYIKSAEVAYPSKKAKQKEVAAVEETEEKKKEADTTAKPATETTMEKPKSAEELQYEALRKKIDKKRESIANSCAGIDADQGYKENVVTWGMSKEEVILVLTKEDEILSEAKAQKDAKTDEVILKIKTPADGPIKDVELHFLHNLLYKAVINFKIVSASTMGRLGSILNERYGFTDEQKEQRKKLQEKGEEFDDAEKAKQAPKKEEKKEEKKTETPIEQSCHWTGTVTVATLYIKLKNDRSSYVDFKLIKESPKAKEEAQALAMKEKQRKADEQKAKEVDLSKKKVTF